MVTFRGQPILVTRSRRRTMSLCIRPNGEIEARIPMRLAERDLQAFVNSKAGWLSARLAETEMRKEREETIPPLTPEEVAGLRRKAAAYLPERVAYYASLLKVTYGKITVRNVRSRWGSCTKDGNLSFSLALMMAPPEVIDSVVVHELCHRREMNHSERFYRAVYSVYPEYRKYHGWLKKNGPILLHRLFPDQV